MFTCIDEEILKSKVELIFDKLAAKEVKRRNASAINSSILEEFTEDNVSLVQMKKERVSFKMLCFSLGVYRSLTSEDRFTPCCHVIFPKHWKSEKDRVQVQNLVELQD